MELHMSNDTQELVKTLPLDVLAEKTKRLSWLELLRLTHCNRFFRETYSHDRLWKPLFTNYFPEKTHITENYKQAFLESYSEWLELVKSDFGTLEHASDYLKSDRKFILSAVTTNGYCLMYASDELKNDKAFMLKAIAKNGVAFTLASSQLKRDLEVVLNAIKKNRHALLAVFNIISFDIEVQRCTTIIDDDERGRACDEVLEFYSQQDSIYSLSSSG
jgi:Domain of unknown function (DUF4116)